MTYAVGSLVRARGREWVVLPESEEDLLVLRPLGGTEDETAGIYLPLEPVEAATFDLPDPTWPGDYRSGRLLRDAVRLGFRSSAGPFRSFGRLAVEPRPYQLVPLLMALKLDPVRLLISDDVGIGKTVEAGLVARELIDRGEANRLAVLCPPPLAEQWQAELREKFHIDAEVVLPSTVTRLERGRGMRESLFERYPYTIVSTDFIKSDRRRHEFLRTCPELVVVDEAHTCAYAEEGRGGSHQRHQLVSDLAADPGRHLLLVTATPHSGKEEAFRSLLALLDSSFAGLPDDLSGPANEHHRRRLAAHFVQRRRADIRHYMDADTPFPEREEREESYTLSPEYKRLFERVLRYAREVVSEPGQDRRRQRVRWWSALALLRSLASSPAAAAATLRSRASTLETETAEEADEVGRRAVLDLTEDEPPEGVDLPPGGDIGEEADDEERNRRRLQDMARAADKLCGEEDEKLKKAALLVGSLLDEGYRPILFCRFIPTADYVAAQLRDRLPRDVEVASVTGVLPPAEREERVLRLSESERRVLVCTDCLSEGINLQERFDAVFHYDLSWNPTRHEQREGRVDRYGQLRDPVRVLTYFGTDNQIDGIVLDVLIRKHKSIRSSLGISVPVPADTNRVVEALFEGLLLRESSGSVQDYLTGFEEIIEPQKKQLFGVWENVSERERRSRTVFAQQTIKVEEVARELAAVRASIGSGVDVERFVKEALWAQKVPVTENGSVRLDLAEAPRALREATGLEGSTVVRFEPPVGEAEIYLHRTHPAVEGLATYTMDTALDPLADGVARRTSVTRTGVVERRTTLLLVRFRFHIATRSNRGGTEAPLLAEDVRVLAFRGSPQNAEWLETEEAEELLHAGPEGNVSPDQASGFIQRVVDGVDAIRPHLDRVAEGFAEEILDAHRRVRSATRTTGVGYEVEAQRPPDILGVYVYLPTVA